MILPPELNLIAGLIGIVWGASAMLSARRRGWRYPGDRLSAYGLLIGGAFIAAAGAGWMLFG